MQLALKALSGIANSVDPDQTAPSGAFNTDHSNAAALLLFLYRRALRLLAVAFFTCFVLFHILLCLVKICCCCSVYIFSTGGHRVRNHNRHNPCTCVVFRMSFSSLRPSSLL